MLPISCNRIFHGRFTAVIFAVCEQDYSFASRLLAQNLVRGQVNTVVERCAAMVPAAAATAVPVSAATVPAHAAATRITAASAGIASAPV